MNNTIIQFREPYSEYSCQFYQMVEWLYDNIQHAVGHRWVFKHSSQLGPHIEFNDEIDAMTFKLMFSDLCK